MTSCDVASITHLALAVGPFLSAPVGEFSATSHSRLRVPKVLELVFIVDERSVPWFVELNAHPSMEAVEGEYSGVIHRVIDEAWGRASPAAAAAAAAAGVEQIIDPLFSSPSVSG